MVPCTGGQISNLKGETSKLCEFRTPAIANLINTMNFITSCLADILCYIWVKVDSRMTAIIHGMQVHKYMSMVQTYNVPRLGLERDWLVPGVEKNHGIGLIQERVGGWVSAPLPFR